MSKFDISKLKINKKEYPVDEILIPSRNIFYSNILKVDEKIKVRGMTVEEQKKLLASTAESQESIINDIVFNCVEYPDNLNSIDLFIIDRDQILTKIRQLTYGDEVKANYQCSTCNTSNETVINLSNLDIKYFDDNLTLPIDVVTDAILVDDKPAKLSFTLPTLNSNKDNEILMRYHKKEKNTRSLMLYTSLFSTLYQINDELVDCQTKNQIMNIYMQLPASEFSKLLNAINNDYGTQSTVTVNCTNCGQENQISIMTTDFFLHI